MTGPFLPAPAAVPIAFRGGPGRCAPQPPGGTLWGFAEALRAPPPAPGGCAARGSPQRNFAQTFMGNLQWRAIWIAKLLHNARLPAADRSQPVAPTNDTSNDMPDYMPSKDADFALWLDNFFTLIDASPTSYGLIAGDATAIGVQNTAFQAAYAISTTPGTRTSATIATTRGARISAEAVCRPYAMRINANQSVSNAQRVDLGLTVRITTPTPVPPPATQPVLMLVSAIPQVHNMQFRDASTPTAKAKPANVVGLELWCSVGTVAATDPAQCTYKQGVTKTPFQAGFSAPDKGKIATYFARWQTRSGPSGIIQTGPWSDPVSSYII